MNAMALATEQYRRVEVETVNKIELLVMLFDGAVRFLREAQQAIVRRDIPLKAEKIDRFLAIIGELRASLNRERDGSFTTRMDALYAYLSQRALEASFHLDPAPCTEVINIIQPIRDAWAHIAKNPPQEVAVTRDQAPAQAAIPPTPLAPASPPLYKQPSTPILRGQSAPERPPLELFG